jgi:hypothetical protein
MSRTPASSPAMLVQQILTIPSLLLRRSVALTAHQFARDTGRLFVSGALIVRRLIGLIAWLCPLRRSRTRPLSVRQALCISSLRRYSFLRARPQRRRLLRRGRSGRLLHRRARRRSGRDRLLRQLRQELRLPRLLHRSSGLARPAATDCGYGMWPSRTLVHT